MRIPRPLPAAILGLLTGLIPACGSEPLGPASGSLAISTATTGDDPDPDGYTLKIDSEQPRAIGPADNLGPLELSAGNHVVTLGGLAANCGVKGENPRTIRVTADRPTILGFEVTCASTTGNLRVTVMATGVDLPGGYRISVDGTESQVVGANGTVTMRAAIGTRQVALMGVASNCRVEGENARSAEVPSDGLVEMRFTVACRVVRASRILFRQGYSRLSSVRLDGSERRDLFARAYVDPGFWSPDGSKIAFEADGGERDVALFVMNADGTGLTTLSHLTSYVPLAWSADGRTIAIFDEGIYLIDVSGGPRRPMTQGIPIMSGSNPVWSPNGQIVFNRWGVPPIFTANADGSEDTLTAPGPGEYDRDAQWSPDGSKIAFMRDTFAEYGDYFVSNLWVMNADGSNPVGLTHYTLDSFQWVWRIAWAGDGNGLVFTDYYHVYRIQVDGSGQTLIFQNRWPIWSPDATRILFQAPGVGGDSDIFMMDADGSNVRNVTNNPGNEEFPAWQP